MRFAQCGSLRIRKEFLVDINVLFFKVRGTLNLHRALTEGLGPVLTFNLNKALSEGVGSWH